MTLGELAAFLQGDLHGPADIEISGPAGPDQSKAGGIAFAENEAYLEKAEAGLAAALLLPRSLSSSKKPFISVDEPRRAFLLLLKKADLPLPLNPGIHPTAVVHKEAQVDPTVQIGPYAVIEQGVKIGKDCRIYPFAYIGEDCELREGCTVFPHAVLYRQVTLDKGSIIHAGSVLGADGFGYVWDGTHRAKVPQVGSVIVGENCEIGALTAIDRATVGETRIGGGTKIDNLVQIAHNVQLGKDCAVASQVGLAGSTRLGDRVLAGGQAGAADHMSIGDDVILAARSGVINDIDEPGEYVGFPARPGVEGKKIMLLTLKLPEIFARLKRLEKRVEDR